MAIPFLLAGFTTLRPGRTSVGLVAYLSRRTVREGGHRYVYGPHAGDLVHEAVLLPEGASLALAEPIGLARAMDAAEPKGTLHQRRKRYPQPGLHLVLALPHDGEMHLDEVVALTHDFVRNLVGRHRLGVYVAIHDPAVKSGSRLRRNRHAHVVVTLRSIEGDRLSRHKERDFIARVRTAGKPNSGGPRWIYVAEGIRWPDAWWSAQNRRFLELGLSTRVQPIAAKPERHYDRQTWRYDSDECEADKRRLRRENRHLAEDDPPTLVETLARGRSALLLSDLRAFLERVIPDPHRRRLRLDAICTHPGIVELAASVSDPRPDRITTVATHTLMHGAAAVIRDAVDSPQARLVCCRGDDVDETKAGLVDAIATIHGRGRRMPEIVIVGSHLSHTEIALDAELPRTTLDDLMKEASRRDHGTLVIAPRSEMLTDLAVARLVVEADQRGWTLLLGVTDDAADAVVDRRLAVVMAGHLAPRLLPADAPIEELRGIAACRLRAGYLAEGIATLSQSTTLEFTAQERAVLDRSTITVRDREPSGEAREPNWGRADAMSPADGDWMPGAWVTASSTDYGTRPPVLRAGRLYEILATHLHRTEDAEACVLDLRDIATGETTTAPASRLHPARSLTIREAWMLKGRIARPLRIILSDPRSAWASLLMAADWHGTAAVTLEIRPRVANSLSELVDRVCASLPAALATDCIRPVDDKARMRVESDLILDEFIGTDSHVIDRVWPGPGRKGGAASIPIDLSALPSELAAAAIHDPLVAAGLQASLDALRGKRAGDLSGSLTEVLASQSPKVPKRGRKAVHSGELDLPVTITHQDRGSPDIWETHKIRLEAKFLSLNSALRSPRHRRDPDVDHTENASAEVDELAFLHDTDVNEPPSKI